MIQGLSPVQGPIIIEVFDTDAIFVGEQPIFEVSLRVFQKETDHIPIKIVFEPFEDLAHIEGVSLQRVLSRIIDESSRIGIELLVENPPLIGFGDQGRAAF